MAASTEDSSILFLVKWSGKEYGINMSGDPEVLTVFDIKFMLEEETGVRPERQKLMGIKVAKGGAITDSTRIAELNVKLGTTNKLMMMGSKEEDIASASERPVDLPDVVNDLDVPDEMDIPLTERGDLLGKISKRVKEVKINVMNDPRPGKKLLVLDIDYTLFDHRSPAETPGQLMRPYLHEFLESAYADYDIVIWSATSMKWIEVKMKQLGVTSNPNYKIAFMVDNLSMIAYHTPERGFLDMKPLGVIWGKFPDFYNSTNTIMFDDIRRNFLMNPQNGLRIKAFRDAHKNQATDNELLKLSVYLKKIAQLDDMSGLDHRKWKKYCDMRDEDVN